MSFISEMVKGIETAYSGAVPRTGITPVDNFVRTITGVDDIENNLATCNWGGLAVAVGTTVIPEGKGAKVASVAAKVTKVEKLATNAASTQTEKLIFEEAISNGGKKVDMTLDDPLYTNGWDKMRYTHTGLDGTKTTVHYMQQQGTNVIEQIKIKNVTLPKVK